MGGGGQQRETMRREGKLEFVMANWCFARPLGRAKSGPGGPVCEATELMRRIGLQGVLGNNYH